MSPQNEKGQSDRVKAIIEAVENFEITEASAWSDLDMLSTHTFIDGVEIDPAGVIVEDNGRFRGALSVYVLLKYGNDEADGFETSDAFAGQFSGYMDDLGAPIIEDISVDTSPFYEGESVAVS